MHELLGVMERLYIRFETTTVDAQFSILVPT